MRPAQRKRIIKRRNYKPGSVNGDNPSRTAITDSLKRPTREQGFLPDRASPKEGSVKPLMLSIRLASDGACHAPRVATWPVVSYTAVSPSPGSSPGSLLSVALSRELPQPDVIRHPALRSPDFPLALRCEAVQTTSQRKSQLSPIPPYVSCSTNPT